MVNLGFASCPLQEYQDGRNLPIDAIDSFVLTLDLVYREFVTKSSLSAAGLNEDEEEAARCVFTALQDMSRPQDQEENVLPSSPPMM